jgi:hypothetical protein
MMVRHIRLDRRQFYLFEGWALIANLGPIGPNSPGDLPRLPICAILYVMKSPAERRAGQGEDCGIALSGQLWDAWFRLVILSLS